jgi:ribosomal protein S27AE
MPIAKRLGLSRLNAGDADTGSEALRNETCDRCGPAVQAAYRAARSGELYLCGHCTNQLRHALSAQGWSIRPVDEPRDEPQTRATSFGGTW